MHCAHSQFLRKKGSCNLLKIPKRALLQKICILSIASLCPLFFLSKQWLCKCNVTTAMYIQFWVSHITLDSTGNEKKGIDLDTTLQSQGKT